MINRRNILASSALLVSAVAARSSDAATPPHVASEGAIPPSQAARDWTISRPMYWSFDNRDPIVEVPGFAMTFHIGTIGPIENTFSLDKDSIRVSKTDEGWLIEASKLALPGQQGEAEGSLRARVIQIAGGVDLAVTATAMENVRTVKVCLHRLASGRVFQTGWQVAPNGQPANADGVTINYPAYTGGMPVWLLGDQQRGIAFSSVDVTTAPKRFGAQLRDGGVTVELIAEQAAQRLASRFEVPIWEIRRDVSLKGAIDNRLARLENSTRLKRWQDRADVAPWARDIDLVVTLHGMHWSGYIFNDYARMLQAVNWITDRVPGKRVMFFLAGWEGRYYRTYGASAADERMGGADGLHKLVQGIHARGARVMAMYAGNASDERLAEFAAYGPQSGFKSLPGAMDWTDMRGYQVDWNEMRAGITGMGWLNPGAPAWRDHLIRQVGDLNATYGFDGSFFDTQPNVNNDYLHDPLQGLTEIADGLRDRKPDLLLATETWYDLSLGVIPMSQTPDGPYNWSDRYQQRFAHVSLGEPSRGSTGVHELGRVPYNLADLLRSFSLPTLGVVADTLEKAPKTVEAVLAAARQRS